MKKVLFGFGIFIAASMATISCSKVVNCIELTTAVVNATNNYSNSQSTANCQALTTAISNWKAEPDCYNADTAVARTNDSIYTALKALCP